MKISNQHTNKILPVIAFALSVQFATAQQATADAIKGSLTQYNSQVLHEKIYVRTDKNFYMAGDIAWFSIYDVDGNKHRPLDISKVAYVELLDQRNNAVLQAKIELSKGKGDGSFHLPISLTSGNYKLRAYTNWMKNFGAEYFFEKQLTVVNSLKATGQPTTLPLPVYNAQFFPEGGNLVNKIRSVVAFKVTDQYGRGVDCTGWIVNEKNDTLAVFSSLKFGMGQFSITPDINSKYKAHIKTAEGKVTTYELPSVQPTGYVLHAASSGDNLVVTVTSNLPAPNVNLVIHTRQSVKHAAGGVLRNGTAEFVVPKSTLGEGISHITLFDNAKQPVCERLYFRQPSQKLQLDAVAEKSTYDSRQKVNLSVTAKDETSRQAASALTLSVFKLDSLSMPDEAGLLSYLWLSADLKGKIESPDYYFTTAPEVAAATDNLMMTHGWRKFNWQHVLANKPPAFEFVPEMYGHIVKGKVINSATGAPAPQVPVSLAIPGNSSHLFIAESNDKGEVIFNMLGYYGSGDLIAQAIGAQGHNFRTEIRAPFATDYTTIPLSPFRLNETYQQPLVAQSVSMQVQQAYFSDSLSRFATPVADTTPFYGRPDKAYLLDDFTRFISMEEVLYEYVLEVILIKREGQLFPHIQQNIEGYLAGDPLVLVDGVPVANHKIATYNPLKVKKLDVVATKYVLGPLGFDGVINFITYNGNMEGMELDPGAIVMDYEGLQLKREFYSPDYEKNSGLSTLPDFRNVLYWSPNIRTSAEGKTNVSFFTSDISGKYIGIIEGMDENGRAGKQTFMFEVKHNNGL
jgi:hypothetical protein